MRRAFVTSLGFFAIAAASLSAQTGARPAARPATRPATAATQAPSATRIVVYKTPTCGCCGKWVDAMRAAGYTLEVHDQDDLTQIKRGAGVSEANASCHTAQVGGYVLEGHVPLESIRRLLRERPAIAGLAVPGMIVGTLGMEQGNQHPAYDVIAIGRDGRSSVYERR